GGSQVRQVLLAGCAKQISLRPIAARIAKLLLESGVEGNGVERHLNVYRSGELGPHSSHALARGSLTWRRFPLDDQHVFASRSGQVISDARPDDSSADDDDVRCLHGLTLQS